MAKFNPLDFNPRTELVDSKGGSLVEFIRHATESAIIDAGQYIVTLKPGVDVDTILAPLKDASVPAALHSPTSMWIPAGLGAEVFGPDPDPWCGESIPDGEFQGTLWSQNPDQQSLVTRMIEQLKSNRFGTMESPVGSGKTVMMTRIVVALGVRTLFVCTTTNLLEQARDQGFGVFAPHLKVGQLRGSKYKTVEGCDVVLTTPRTLASKHDPVFLQQFGLLVFDEAHKAATAEMGRAAAQLRCKYRLGVSATLRRNDDKFLIIPAILGDIRVRLKRIWENIVYVRHILDYGNLNSDQKFIVGELTVPEVKYGPKKGRPDFHAYQCIIAAHEGRTRAIVAQLVEDLKSRKKIFVFAERVNHLEAVRDELAVHGVEAGVLHSKTNKGDELGKTLAHSVVLSTYASGVEGVNDSAVDTIYYISPFSKASTNRVEQSIGRCRPGDGKLPPLVRDWVDRCNLGWAMHAFRRKLIASLNPVEKTVSVSIHR